MYSAGVVSKLLDTGFPIRKSTDQRLLTAPRGLSQFCHVLHRLLVPRHPPNALNSLTTENWFVSTVTTPACTELATARTLRQTVKSCLRSPPVHRLGSDGGGPRREGYLCAANIPDASTSRFTSSRGVDLVLGLMRISTSLHALGATLAGLPRACLSCFTLRSTIKFSLTHPVLKTEWRGYQWAKQDLNLRPRAYQARALTN
jgi:hypothetical protein